jgi:hypothetical protein
VGGLLVAGVGQLWRVPVRRSGPGRQGSVRWPHIVSVRQVLVGGHGKFR